MFSILRKYAGDIAAGIMASLTALLGAYVTLPPETLQKFAESGAEILVALAVALVGSGISALNTKVQTKEKK